MVIIIKLYDKLSKDKNSLLRRLMSGHFIIIYYEKLKIRTGDKMRLFIGIGLPNEVKDYLTEQQALVKNASLKGNFSLYDNFHITLKFIGEVEDYEVDGLIDIIDEVATKHAAFTIKVGQLGSFNRKDKHIVFSEIIDGVTPLKELQKNLEQELLSDAFIDKKETYKPHITLAREVKLTEVSLLNTVTSYPEAIPINEITLFESKRNKQGQLFYEPIYVKSLLVSR
jgi:RNA 2',3'-cyclic 3'-phosphodiesterase